jgi:lysine 6-dehydrogenase
VEEVHIKCGGIPQEPKPPLGYKIVFGGTRLPLHTAKARVVQGGKMKEVERYSGVEPVYFEGVGHLECYQEGFPLHLLELPGMEGAKECTEKTVRWPGYSEKINFLRECGFLDTKPLSIGQGEIAPLTFLNALLYPRVKLEEGEKDITVLRVEVIGEREQKRVKYRFEMVDFYDQEGEITSMARTTSYPCAIVCRMLGRGEIRERGLFSADKVIAGEFFDSLMGELARRGVRIQESVEETRLLP